MRERFAEGKQVFHPGDARWDGQVADKVGKLIIVIAGEVTHDL